MAEQVVCGNDVERLMTAIQKYLDAGYDEVYVGLIRSDQRGFLDFYSREILHRFKGEAARLPR